MSRHSTPTSGLGKLALRDIDTDMPVVTRARSNQARDLQASQAALSRASAGPSVMRAGTASSSRAGPSRAARSSGRVQIGRQQVDRQQAARAPPGGSSGDDSDESDDDDDDDDDEQSTDQDAAQVNDRRATIYQALFALLEDGLSPHEFATSDDPNLTPATRLAQCLAGALDRLVRDDQDLNILRTSIPVPGPLWSQQLRVSMERRYEAIAKGLKQNAFGNGGQDVVGTIKALRSLFTNIDEIRVWYFSSGMDVESQNGLMTLLVTMLGFIVEKNEDVYHGTNRPAYAGEGNRNERRVFSCFVAEESQPQEFLRVMTNATVFLTHEATRLEDINDLMQAYVADGLEGLVDEGRLGGLAVSFAQLAQRVRAMV